MLIRQAVGGDIPRIMQLVKAVVPLMQAAGNEQWNQHYPNAAVFENDIELNQLWVAEVDGDIAGISAITGEQYPEYQQVGWDISEPAIVTHRLAVNPAHRGAGIAAALLEQARQVAITKGIPLLRIDTNAMNVAAQKLFLKAGYLFAGNITLEFRPGQSFCCFEQRL